MHPPGFQRKSITPKESLSEKIKAGRERKQVSLGKAEQETKIRARYLEAIEDGRYDSIPQSYCKGFIRRYAEYLGLPKDTIEQELQLLFLHRPQKQPFSFRPITKHNRWLVTPKIMASGLLIVVLVGFIGYITYQVRQFAAPPQLEITKPVGESVVTTENFTIEGKTDLGATVYIDNVVASTNSDGTFSYIVTLRPGLNQITVKAENRIKKQSVKVVPVLYQYTPPPPTPTPSETPIPPTTSPQPGAGQR